MKACKFMVVSLIALGVMFSTNTPIARGMGLTYVVQGVYQLAVPTGSHSWTVTFSAGRAYEINLGLYTPGHARFVLSVVDPWAQAYTFVDLEFWHSDGSDDLWASTFTAPLTGQYTFALASTGGTGQALQAYFAIIDAGTLHNTHTHSGMPLADAHACNLSHAVWTYFVTLEGSTTYFLDVARGDPSGVEIPIVVKTKVQALNGPEIPVLGETLLPWEVPKCNETQKMTWAGDWFGVSASTTYNLVIEVSGLVSLNPVVVALTLGKEQAHGNATPPAGDPAKDDPESPGLQVGLEGVMMVGGPCAIALCVVAIAIVGTKRKRGVRGTAGVMKREAPTEGW